MRSATVLALTIVLVTLTISPAAGQYTATGSKNAILGIYLSAGRMVTLAPWTTLTLGATYSETLGTEPLVALGYSRPLSGGWNVAFVASSGGIGGDYRVDRLPEVSLSRGAQLPGTGLFYGLELGAGNYTVRPNGLTGYRFHAAARLSTPAYPLGRFAGTAAEIGYRQFAYTAAAHGAGWGTARLTITPAPPLSLTFSYLRQIPSGSSPLLFDAMGEESTLSGSVSFRVLPAVTLSHAQAYSYLSGALVDRIYGLSVTVPGGPTISVSWDTVDQTGSLSFSW